MSEQVAPSSASDAAAAQPAVETPQPTPAQPQTAKSDGAAPTAPAPDTAAPTAPAPDGAAPTAPTPDATAPDAGKSEEKSGGKKALGIVGVILAIVVIAGLKFGVAAAIGNYFNKDETADAKTGDCIAELPEVTGTKQEKADGAKVVSCTSTDAAYTVVGRVEDQSEAQARAGTACDQYLKEGEEGYVFSSIKPGKTGYVLCLTKKA
ncbi:hypothetical protein [Micromonospora sp. B9E7]|uniref:LppU/SCO3897 family protein n=1 Tax=Micromonospora sp. B9E7 TaxID=3153574 RepID=UPI00325DE74E